MAHRYEAFLSYSHALDLELARELKRGLERFAKPRTEPRTMLVFRDEENLAATPALWRKLEGAVEDSGALVLLASPESAASPGVLHELRTWFERVEEAPRRTFIVLTRGRIVEGENERIDWRRTDALPESLARHFEHVPRYLSAPEPSERRLRWRDPRVLELIADLSAAIQDVPKETLWSSELREQRRRRRRNAGLVAVLSLLSLALTVAVGFAVENADRARRGEGEALEARDGARARYRDSQRNLANATALLARAARDQGDRAAATTYAAAAAGTYPTPAVQAEHLLRPRPRTRPLLRFRAAHSARPFLAVDPEGEVLVTAGGAGMAVVRDLATARVRALLRPSAGTPVSAAFSPAGSLLALGVDWSSSRRTLDARDPDRATSLVLYQVGTWEERRQLGRRGLFSRADCIGFSVDSRWLAAGVDDRLLVWDLSSSSPPIERRLDRQDGGGLSRLAFGRGASADAIAATSRSGNVLLFRLPSLDLTQRASLPAGIDAPFAPLQRLATYDLCWSSEDTLVVCSRGAQLLVTRIGDFGAFEHVEGHGALTSAVAWLPGPDLVLSAAWDGRLRLLEAATLRLVESVRTGTEGTHGLGHDAGGRLAVALGDGGVVSVLRVEDEPHALALDGTLNRIAFAGRSGELLFGLGAPLPEPGQALDPAADELELLSCAGAPGQPSPLAGEWEAWLETSFPPSRAVALARTGARGRWVVADACSRDVFAEVACEASPAQAPAALAPSRELLAVALPREGPVTADPLATEEDAVLPHEARSQLMLIDLEGAAPPRSLAETARIVSLSFDGSGRRLAASTLHGGCWVFELETLERRSLVPLAPGAPLRVSFEPHGTRLVGMEATGRVWIVDARDADARPSYLVSLERGFLGATAFHPAGDLLAVAPSDGSLWLYHLGRREPVAGLPRLGRPIRSLAFRADGLVLAAGDASGALRLLGPGAGESSAAVQSALLLSLDLDTLELQRSSGRTGSFAGFGHPPALDVALCELWELVGRARSLQGLSGEDAAEEVARELSALASELDEAHALLAEQLVDRLRRAMP